MHKAFEWTGWIVVAMLSSGCGDDTQNASAGGSGDASGAGTASTPVPSADATTAGTAGAADEAGSGNQGSSGAVGSTGRPAGTVGATDDTSTSDTGNSSSGDDGTSSVPGSSTGSGSSSSDDGPNEEESGGETGGRGGIPCTPEDPCSANLACDYPDGLCGAAGDGVCVFFPPFCPPGIIPVCGCDGVDYQNICFALVAGVDVDETDPDMCGP